MVCIKNIVTIDESLKFLSNMGKLFPRAVDRSLMILGFCKDGNIEEAKRVYDMMNRGDFPSALVYDSLVTTFCENGRVKEALGLTSEMIGRGYFPVIATCNGIISGLCKQGKVVSVHKLLEDIVERGFLPDRGSFLPGGFCRKCDLEKRLFAPVRDIGKRHRS